MQLVYYGMHTKSRPQFRSIVIKIILMGSKLIPILISILLIWVTLTIFHINNQEKMVHQPHGIEKIYSLLTKMTMTTTKITTTTTQNKNITEIELFKENLDTKLIMDRTCNCEHSYFKKLANVIYKKPSSYIHNGVINYINSAKNYSEKNVTKLAISFVIHNNPGLFEVLFHLLFRPYNDYCIVIDEKTILETKNSFKSIINCYQEIFPDTNIIIVNWTKPIYWGGYSILNADLTCLELLYNSSR